MKKSNKWNFVLGFVLGAIIFGGVTAYAAGIMAAPKTATIKINGGAVDLKGYIIEGTHYFQLRDLSAALKPSGKDFSVVWDGKNNSVLIDTTKGYNPSEQLPQTTTTTTPITGGYGTVYHPLKKGDVVKTSPVEGSTGSVGGDYTITQGAEEKPWKTSDGTTWPNVLLPDWQTSWDGYTRITMPSPAPVHFKGEVRGTPFDSLYVFNDYEVERMIRTIYKYAKNNTSLWKDHDPSTNVPNFTIKVVFEEDMTYNTFYPWRDYEVQKQVESTGGGTEFRIYAYDTYNNGKFIDTEYFMK